VDLYLDFIYGSCLWIYVPANPVKNGKSSLQQAQSLAEALAALANERRVFEETAKAIEEGTKRKALEEFLATMRVEERHYIRQNRFLFAHRKSLIMQERIFFRNIPLSNWVEHEVPIEEGANLNDAAKTLSVFSAVEEQAIPQRVRLQDSHLLAKGEDFDSDVSAALEEHAGGGNQAEDKWQHGLPVLIWGDLVKPSR